MKLASRIVLGALALQALCVPTVRAQVAAEGLAVPETSSRETGEARAERDKRMAWWRDARFGLFIHWGVYAVPAGQWGSQTDAGEWIMHSEQIPTARYRALAGEFNPTAYSPDAWAKIAQDAGMRYMVITAKHHDGFALWPSRASTWNIAEATPYKKDLLGPLVGAAHRHGLKIGFYYSQAQDWMNPGGAKVRFPEGQGWDPAQSGNFDQYITETAAPQVEELIKDYPIDLFWWDTPAFMNATRADQLAAKLKSRPQLVVNDRLGGGVRGDYFSPEQYIPLVSPGEDWETCMTLNRHWGFNVKDLDYKSSKEIIRMLAETVGKGGNFLLNVGPDASGRFPEESVRILGEVGAWMKVNGASIYGTQAGPVEFAPYGTVTRKGRRLYFHVFDWPETGILRLPLGNRQAKARLLARMDRPLEVRSRGGLLEVAVPKSAPDRVNSVVVVDLPEEPLGRPLITAGAKVEGSVQGGDLGTLTDSNVKTAWVAAPGFKEASVSFTLARPQAIAGLGFGEPDVWPRLRQSYRVEALVDGKWQLLSEGQTTGHGAIRGFNSVVTRTVKVTMKREAGGPGLSEVRLYPSLY